jgi:DNA-directed RNA polymerase subunit beta
MGANMQRQAVPLLVTEAADRGDRIEHKWRDRLRVVVMSEGDGVVTRVNAREIEVRYDDGRLVTYKLRKFARSNRAPA